MKHGKLIFRTIYSFLLVAVLPSILVSSTKAQEPSEGEFEEVQPAGEGIIYHEKTEVEGNRVSRLSKKVFDSDLIDAEELPEGQTYVPTRGGWKGEDGKLYNQRWLAEKRGVAVEDLDKLVVESSQPPRREDDQKDLLEEESEVLIGQGPKGLAPDDDD